MKRLEMLRKIRRHWNTHATASAVFDFSNTTDEKLREWCKIIDEVEKIENESI